MSATAVINNLRALGCELRADGNVLHVRPGALLTDELRAQIKTHKAEMLAILTRRNVPVNLDWAIQWSRKHRLWHCVYCKGLSKTVDFDTLFHSANPAATGNVLLHRIDCCYLVAITSRNGLELNQ